MKFSTVFAVSALYILPSSLTLAASVAYNTAFDNAAGSLDSVACSDGPNGLETRNYTTFGSLPKFPYIGGAAAVTGWNSPNCGTCWELIYTNAQSQNKIINVLAIDRAGDGFTIGLTGMNELTGGQGTQLGRVDVAAKQVASSVCGL